MFGIIKHYRVTLVALVIAVTDAWSVAQTNPEGWSAFFSDIVVVLLMPVWLPKMCVLYVIGFCLQIPLVGTHSSLNEFWQLLFYGLGDLVVCYIYFQLFQLIRRRWRQVKQNEAEIKSHRAR
jgi:hypothetical protein